MADNTLDQINAIHDGDVRRWIANLIVAGGATNKQVVAALGKTYGVTVTPRSVSQWRNRDPVLVEFIAELEAAKAELQDDDPDALGDLLTRVREPVNRAQLDDDLLTLSINFPAFGVLMSRPPVDGATVETTAWGVPIAPRVPADAAAEKDDALAALLADHETDEAFAADCLSRLTPEEREEIAHLLETP